MDENPYVSPEAGQSGLPDSNRAWSRLLAALIFGPFAGGALGGICGAVGAAALGGIYLLVGSAFDGQRAGVADTNELPLVGAFLGGFYGAILGSIAGFILAVAAIIPWVKQPVLAYVGAIVCALGGAFVGILGGFVLAQGMGSLLLWIVVGVAIGLVSGGLGGYGLGRVVAYIADIPSEYRARGLVGRGRL